MDGFLPFSRASLMLDSVVVAMFIVLPIQVWSIHKAKAGQWQLHRNVQLITSIVLLLAVVAFEIDIRLNGWRHLAEVSPYYDSIVFPALFIHLFFAICTPFIWGFTLIKAMRQFGYPVKPTDYLQKHKRWGKISFGFLCGTSFTGWAFYYLAFMA